MPAQVAKKGYYHNRPKSWRLRAIWSQGEPACETECYCIPIIVQYDCNVLSTCISNTSESFTVHAQGLAKLAETEYRTLILLENNPLRQGKVVEGSS